jgi:hypothetical protein
MCGARCVISDAIDVVLFTILVPTVNFAGCDHPLVPFALVTQTRQKYEVFIEIPFTSK